MNDSNGNKQLMGKYKINDEVFFKSIDGLADGTYCFKLCQFDKDDNEIASTDYILFSLGVPKNPGSDGNDGGQGYRCVGPSNRHNRFRGPVIVGK